MENAHTIGDLLQMQSMPLDAKVLMTKARVRAWYESFDGNVYLSFSGGKDSTVLKHIIDSMYSDVPSVFVDTGLEYPEIRGFVQEVKAGQYECFNSDVEILRPSMRFDEVIKKYGYPVVSKEISHTVRQARNLRPGKTKQKRLDRLNGCETKPNGEKSKYNDTRWRFLLDAPFEVSEQCCDVMKKRPAHKYEKKTGRKPIVATMADEGMLRLQQWLRNGCNSFEGKVISKPMSFWTEQDVLQYLKRYAVPYCSVYGKIINADELEGQLSFFQVDENLTTSGCKRTGCMYCGFGAHLDQRPNRYERMKETHPKQYDYCMRPLDQGGAGYG